LAQLGDPQKNLKVIHVAGSKGKGSVCAMTAAILRRAGYKVGLYTSPHINTYRERIRVLSPASTETDGRGEDIFPDMISEQDLCRVIDEIKPVIDRACAGPVSGRVTFFEMYTVLALYYFHQQQTDFVVLETGLGGRLDATNVADSLVAVITPISLEHTDILGNTVARIAGEKAAIIKTRGQMVVLAPQERDAREVLMARCREFECRVVRADFDHDISRVRLEGDGQTFDLQTPGAKYGNLSLRLMGAHQRRNASVAVAAVECLRERGTALPPDCVRRGLRDVFWPGRFEVFSRQPLVILDGAHNGSSARALARTVREVYGAKKVVLVAGFSEDKNETSILRELEGLAAKTILAKSCHPRAKSLTDAVSVADALDLARDSAGPDDMILVTGSLFIISEARQELLKNGVVSQ